MREKFNFLLVLMLLIIVDKIFTTDENCFSDKDLNQIDWTKHVAQIFYNETQNCIYQKECPKIPSNSLLKISVDDSENFKLSIKPLDNSEAVLNVSMKNIQFKKLTIKVQVQVQRSESDNEPYCHVIDFQETKRLNLSWHSLIPQVSDMVIQLFIEDDGSHYYFKQYHFKAPSSQSYGNPDIIKNHVFTYVDTTNTDNVRLYLQPLPENYNVTTYQISAMQSGNNNEELSKVYISIERMYYDWNQFPEDDKLYYFKIEPLSSLCENHCAQTVSPHFIMSSVKYLEPDQELVLMIVGVIWIPFAMFFAFYKGYIYYKKREVRRLAGGKPNCLLVYSPTHDAHINVMINLCKYLRGCHINAMIDVLDIPKETHKNPSLWCDYAFSKANTIIVVTSPPNNNNSTVVTKTIYRHLDRQALNLIDENYYKKTKQYFAVKFAYCKQGSLPFEARSFKLFTLPKNLKKLVNKIHGRKFTELLKTSDQELTNNIRLAENVITKGESNDVMNILENGNMEPPLIPDISETDDEQKSSSDQGNCSISEEENINAVEFYSTKIYSLPGLLGSSEEDDQSDSEEDDTQMNRNNYIDSWIASK